eukprot:m.90153 g.90153  ORF g.90153 m.90153 type:complete len:181 (+) comp12301_c5_seq1:992-1534(+)
MPPGKNNKILQYMNFRMRVTTGDGRMLIGTFMAYDKHMNMVLGECEEQRVIKSKKGGEDQTEKRSLGLVLLRGENVLSMSVEGPPPVDNKRSIKVAAPGPGVGKVAGRGIAAPPMNAPPVGLRGPAMGVGGPAPNNMMPPGMRPPMRPPGFNAPPPGFRPPNMPPMGMRPPPGFGRGGPM